MEVGGGGVEVEMYGGEGGGENGLKKAYMLRKGLQLPSTVYVVCLSGRTDK